MLVWTYPLFALKCSIGYDIIASLSHSIRCVTLTIKLTSTSTDTKKWLNKVNKG